jgi:hypothetical protein
MDARSTARRFAGRGKVIGQGTTADRSPTHRDVHLIHLGMVSNDGGFVQRRGRVPP